MHSAGSDPPDWEIRRVPLSFRIGEAPVFRVHLRVHVPTKHFLEVEPVLDAAALPDVVRRTGSDGALLRSHPMEEATPRLRIRDGWIRYRRARYTRYLTDLTGTHQQYLGRFSAKTRSTLLRKVRRFQEAAGAGECFREYRNPQELAQFYPLARSLSARTFQERLLDAGLPDDEPFRTHMREQAALDRVRAYLLFMGQRPVAYLYCPSERDSRVLLYQYLGYDPEFASLSPGTVLQYLALERLFAEGSWRFFDFLEGETQEKRLFATRSVPCVDLLYLRRSVRNAALVLAHVAMESASDAVSSFLERAAIKRTLKHWIRRHAARRTGPESPPTSSAPASPNGGESIQP